MIKIIIGHIGTYQDQMLKVNGLRKFFRLMIVQDTRGHHLGFMLMVRVSGKMKLLLHCQEESFQKERTIMF